MRKVLLNRIIGMLCVGLLLALAGSIFAQTPIPAKYNGLVSNQELQKSENDAVNVPFEDGHVFAAVGNGQVQHYDAAGNLLEVLNSNLGGFTTGMATDSAGNLYVTNFSLALVSRFTGPGVPHNHTVHFNTDPASSVESILFDRQGNIYVGQADGTRDILKFDAAGNLLQRYDVATEDRGSDWIDLAADQQTMYYTSEGNTVKRFDVANNVQLSDFSTALPGSIAYALRLLPEGGMLVADTEVIVRLDSTGSVVQAYDAPGEDTWFALNLDPDGTSFWSGNFGTSNFYKFDIQTGALLAGPFNTGTGAFTLFGLAVFGEIAVGQNNRPTCQVQPAGPFFINENQPLAFTVSGTDPDAGDEITLAVANLPAGATMTPGLPLPGPNTGVSSVFNWTPTTGQGGTYQLVYTVTDTSNASDTCTVQITVNSTPVVQANPAGPFVVQVNQPLTFDVLASDPDLTDMITLSVIDLPAGATMNPPLPLPGLGSGISSVFDWTPAANQAGNYLVTYSVTDGSASSQTTVSITVEANDPPLCQITPAGPFTVLVGELLTFNVSASDPNPLDTITLSVSGLPSGAVMNPALPLPGPASGISSDFSWTPAPGQEGSYQVLYTVVDNGGLQDTCSAQITVLPAAVNHPPVCQVAPPGPFTIEVGELLAFTVLGSDPDSMDAITLSVSSLPSGAVMNPALPLPGPASGISSDFSWTPAPGQEGSYQVLYTVEDNGGLQDTCSAQITVLPAAVNHPPVCQVSLAGPVIIEEGDPLSFTVSASDPDSVDTITLSVNALPAGATMTPPLPFSGPAGGIASVFDWTPASGQSGNYTISYMVLDDQGASSTCNVEITVNAPVVDTISPSCAVTGGSAGPPATLEITIQDDESGLAQINVLIANNASINIPPFTVGTNDPVVVVATKLDQSQTSMVLLQAFDVAGNSIICDPVYQRISTMIPEGYALKQNFPNPFNPETRIDFDVPSGNGGAVNVSIKVYDITGREVKSLLERNMQPGQYSVEWDATNNSGATVAGGIYLYRMVAGDFVATRKMILLK